MFLFSYTILCQKISCFMLEHWIRSLLHIWLLFLTPFVVWACYAKFCFEVGNPEQLNEYLFPVNAGSISCLPGLRKEPTVTSELRGSNTDCEILVWPHWSYFPYLHSKHIVGSKDELNRWKSGALCYTRIGNNALLWTIHGIHTFLHIQICARCVQISTNFPLLIWVWSIPLKIGVWLSRIPSELLYSLHLLFRI